MKHFVLFIGLFFCLLTSIDHGLGLVMDAFFEKIRTGQHGGKINQYLAFPRTPELVIMGSSRAAHQVIPDSFKINAFNLGHGGMYMPFHTALLRMMEQKNKLPKIILLQIDPYEFMGKDKTRDVQNLKYYYHQSDTLCQYINELSPFEKYKYHLDLYRYNGRVINIFHNYLKTQHVLDPGNGYEMVPATPRDSLNTLYSSKNDLPDPGLTLNLQQFRYLSSFIKICQRNHIQLICFTAPFFKSLDYFHKGSIQLAKKLKEEGIPYINYAETLLPEVQSHPHFWRDNRHLNHEGSKILSASLARELKSLIR